LQRTMTKEKYGYVRLLCCCGTLLMKCGSIGTRCHMIQTSRPLEQCAKLKSMMRAITKLYDKVDMYSADDRWYFDMPLAIWLRKPLRSRRRWLVNARILVNKSADPASIGQTTMNQYFAHIPSIWTVRNASLKRIESVRGYIQTNLLSLWGSRMPGPG
jgi:hypothetical protein